MKKIILLTFSVLFYLIGFSETINLKITYNGKGISGHTVSVLIGGTKIGQGVTDGNGDVSISVSSLPSKHIDLKGEKTCDGGKKSWEISGYVTLDQNNFAELKMEIPIKDMVEGSGGFMNENMLVSSYGLVCGGNTETNTVSNNSNTTTNNSNTTTNSSGTNVNSNSSPTSTMMTKEESLANQKSALESKISNTKRKIDKKNEKINSGELTGSKKNMALYDVKEMEVENKITQNKLDKVNLTIANGRLNKAERNGFKDKDSELKQELNQVRVDRRNGKSLLSEEERAKSIEVNEEELKEMSIFNLKKSKINFKSMLSKKKMKLKTNKKFMKPNEIEKLEEEVSTLENSIELIEKELEVREEEKSKESDK